MNPCQDEKPETKGILKRKGKQSTSKERKLSWGGNEFKNFEQHVEIYKLSASKKDIDRDNTDDREPLDKPNEAIRTVQITEAPKEISNKINKNEQAFNLIRSKFNTYYYLLNNYLLYILENEKQDNHDKQVNSNISSINNNNNNDNINKTSLTNKQLQNEKLEKPKEFEYGIFKCNPILELKSNIIGSKGNNSNSNIEGINLNKVDKVDDSNPPTRQFSTLLSNYEDKSRKDNNNINTNIINTNNNNINTNNINDNNINDNNNKRVTILNTRELLANQTKKETSQSLSLNKSYYNSSYNSSELKDDYPITSIQPPNFKKPNVLVNMPKRLSLNNLKDLSCLKESLTLSNESDSIENKTKDNRRLTLTLEVKENLKNLLNDNKEDLDDSFILEESEKIGSNLNLTPSPNTPVKHEYLSNSPISVKTQKIFFNSCHSSASRKLSMADNNDDNGKNDNKYFKDSKDSKDNKMEHEQRINTNDNVIKEIQQNQQNITNKRVSDDFSFTNNNNSNDSNNNSFPHNNNFNDIIMEADLKDEDSKTRESKESKESNIADNKNDNDTPEFLERKKNQKNDDNRIIKDSLDIIQNNNDLNNRSNINNITRNTINYNKVVQFEEESKLYNTIPLNRNYSVNINMNNDTNEFSPINYKNNNKTNNNINNNELTKNLVSPRIAGSLSKHIFNRQKNILDFRGSETSVDARKELIINYISKNIEKKISLAEESYKDLENMSKKVEERSKINSDLMKEKENKMKKIEQISKEEDKIRDKNTFNQFLSKEIFGYQVLSTQNNKLEIILQNHYHFSFTFDEFNAKHYINSKNTHSQSNLPSFNLISVKLENFISNYNTSSSYNEFYTIFHSEFNKLLQALFFCNTTDFQNHNYTKSTNNKTNNINNEFIPNLPIGPMTYNFTSFMERFKYLVKYTGSFSYLRSLFNHQNSLCDLNVQLDKDVDYNFNFSSNYYSKFGLKFVFVFSINALNSFSNVQLKENMVDYYTNNKKSEDDILKYRNLVDQVKKKLIKEVDTSANPLFLKNFLSHLSEHMQLL